MQFFLLSYLRLCAAYVALDGRRRGDPGGRGDRGDVPGWVLITVMTIGLGVALFKIIGPQLKQALRHALNQLN